MWTQIKYISISIPISKTYYNHQCGFDDAPSLKSQHIGFVAAVSFEILVISSFSGVVFIMIKTTYKSVWIDILMISIGLDLCLLWSKRHRNVHNKFLFRYIHDHIYSKEMLLQVSLINRVIETRPVFLWIKQFYKKTKITRKERYNWSMTCHINSVHGTITIS